MSRATFDGARSLTASHSAPGITLLEPAEQDIARDPDAATDAANAGHASAGDGGVCGLSIDPHQIGNFFDGQYARQGKCRRPPVQRFRTSHAS
jgi:hypothetical protein